MASLEMEAYDDDAWVGETRVRGADQPDASGSAVRQSIAEEGPGTLVIVDGLVASTAPETLVPAAELLLVRGSGDELERVAARVHVEQGGERRFSQELTVADIASPFTDYSTFRAWLEISSGAFISKGGEGRLEIEVTGNAEVRADVLYWSCG